VGQTSYLSVANSISCGGSLTVQRRCVRVARTASLRVLSITAVSFTVAAAERLGQPRSQRWHADAPLVQSQEIVLAEDSPDDL